MLDKTIQTYLNLFLPII